MDIDQQTATALGFPKPQYMSVERERRWLCREVPRERVFQTEEITDLYVTGTRLRLREARPIDGGAPMLRLSRKADIDLHTRLITSIYRRKKSSLFWRPRYRASRSRSAGTDYNAFRAS